MRGQVGGRIGQQRLDLGEHAPGQVAGDRGGLGAGVAQIEDEPGRVTRRRGGQLHLGDNRRGRITHNRLLNSQRCADWLTDAGWRDYAARVRAYSMDLRERVVAAVDEGMSQSQAAERFGVSLRTVERYLARRRATGSLAATEQRHGREPRQR